MIGGKSNDDPYTSAERRNEALFSSLAAPETRDQDFFGGMSTGLAHDLQNLLTPISTCLQMVSTRPQDALELLPLALRNLESVQDYVRQARWFAEHSVPQWQLVPLEPLLNRALGLLEDRIRAKSLKTRLVAARETVAEVDAVLLLRLITNLLANAVDVAPQGSEIVLELGKSAGGGRMRLTVTDQGVGIPPEMVKLFFMAETGSQSDSVRSGKPGLGWAICRRIVELHGGQIDIASREQGGTAIHVDLPVRQEKST